MPVRKPVYLDHAATTPVHPLVLEAMTPYFTQFFGNPSGAHRVSQKAAAALSKARRRVAKVLHCTPGEILFTSGGSESDNLAIRGVAERALVQKKGKHIITSPVEHPAVENTIESLCQQHGFEKTVLPVDSKGRIDPSALRQAIRPDTILISIIYGSNEVGTLQPLAELSAIAKEFDIPFHSDAVQAGVCLDLNVEALGVDLLSLSGHKIYGPRGIGVLYLRKGLDLQTQITGGSQEENRRAGTENVAAIIGFTEALELAEAEKQERSQRLNELSLKLWQGIQEKIPEVSLTGDGQQRLPGHVSLVFKGVRADTLLMHLDMAGICASSGSACATGNPEPSSILLAMGFSPELASSALRFTLGRETKQEEIDYVLEVLPTIIEKIR